MALSIKPQKMADPRGSLTPSRLRNVSFNWGVYVRARPPTLVELEKCGGYYQSIVEKGITEGTVRVPSTSRSPTKYSESYCFSYDGVFLEDRSQGDVYETCVRPLIPRCVEGQDTNIIVYGASGTGKRTLLQGSSQSTDLGLIIEAVADIFAHVSKSASPTEITIIRASYVQIKGDTIVDMLRGGTGTIVKVVDDSQNGIHVPDLSHMVLSKPEDIITVLSKGSACNANDSTRHTILNVSVEKGVVKAQGTPKKLQEAPRAIYRVETCGTLNFVRLAGSDKAKPHAASPLKRDEAHKINSDFLALANVCQALYKRDFPRSHVPYRDSKLTHYLRNWLTPISQTNIITTVRTAKEALQETLSSLKYSQRLRCWAEKESTPRLVGSPPYRVGAADAVGDRKGSIPLELMDNPTPVSDFNNVKYHDPKIVVPSNRAIGATYRVTPAGALMSIPQNSDNDFISRRMSGRDIDFTDFAADVAADMAADAANVAGVPYDYVAAQAERDVSRSSPPSSLPHLPVTAAIDPVTATEVAIGDFHPGPQEKSVPAATPTALRHSLANAKKAYERITNDPVKPSTLAVGEFDELDDLDETISKPGYIGNSVNQASAAAQKIASSAVQSSVAAMLNAKLESTEVELANAKKKCKKLRDTLVQKDEAIKRSSKEVEAEKAATQELEMEKESVETQMTVMKKDLSREQSEVMRLRQQVDNLEFQASKKEADNTTLRDELKKMAESHHDIKEELENVKQRLHDSECLAEERQRTLSRRNQEIDFHKKQAAEADRQVVVTKDDLAATKELVAQAARTADSLTDQLRLTTMRETELGRELQHVKSLWRTEVNELQKTIQTIRQESQDGLAAEEAKAKSLEAELRALHDHLASEERKAGTLANEKQEVKHSHEMVQRELNHATAELATLKETQAKLRSEMEGLLGTRSSMTVTIQQLKHEISEAHNRVNELTSAKHMLESQLDKKGSEHMHIVEKLRASEDKADANARVITRLEGEVDIKKNALAAAQDKERKMQSDIEGLRLTITTWTGKVEADTAEIDRLTKENTDLLNRNEKLQEDLHVSRTEALGLKERLEIERHEHRNRSRELEEESNARHVDMTHAKRDITIWQDKAKSFQEGIEEEKNKSALLSSELSRVTKDLRSKEEAYRREIEGQSACLQMLKDREVELMDSIRATEADLRDKESRLNDAKTSHKDSEAGHARALSEWNHERDGLQARIKLLLSELHSTSHEKGSIEKNHVNLVSQYDRLSREHSIAVRERDEVRKALEDTKRNLTEHSTKLREGLDSTSAEKSMLEKDKSELMNKLETTETTLEQANRRIEDMERAHVSEIKAERSNFAANEASHREIVKGYQARIRELQHQMQDEVRKKDDAVKTLSAERKSSASTIMALQSSVDTLKSEVEKESLRSKERAHELEMVTEEFRNKEDKVFALERMIDSVKAELEGEKKMLKDSDEESREAERRFNEERAAWERETAEAQHQIQQLNQQLVQEREDHMSVIRKDADMETVRVQLSIDLENERQRLHKLEIEIEQLKQTNHVQTNELGSRAEQSRQDSDLITRLRQDIENARASLKEVQQQLDESKLSNHKLSKQIKELAHKDMDKKKEIERLNNLMTTLTKKLENQQAASKDREVENSNAMDELRRRLEEERISFNKASDSRETRIREIELNLQGVMMAKSSLEDDFKTANETIADLEHRLAEVTKESEQNGWQARNMTNATTSLEGEVAELRNQIETVQYEKQKLAQEVIAAGEEKERLRRSYDQAQALSKRFEESTKEMQREATEWKSKHERAVSSMQRMSKTKAHAKRLLADYSIEYRALKDRVDSQSIELSEARESLNKTSEELASVSAQKDVLSADVERLDALCKSTTASLRAAQHNHQLAKSAEDRSKAAVSELETEVSELRSENSDMQAKILSNERTHKARVKDLDEIASKLRASQSQLSSDLKDTKTKLDEETSRANAAESNSQSLQTKIARLHSDNERLHAEIAVLHRSADDATSRIGELKHALSLKDMEVDKLESNLEARYAEVTRLSSIESELKEELAQWKRKADVASTSLSEFKAKLREANTQVHNLELSHVDTENALCTTREKLLNTENDLRDARSNIVQVESQLKSTRGDKDKLSTENERQIAEIARLTEEKRELGAKNKSGWIEREELSRDLDRCRADLDAASQERDALSRRSDGLERQLAELRDQHSSVTQQLSEKSRRMDTALEDGERLQRRCDELSEENTSLRENKAQADLAAIESRRVIDSLERNRNEAQRDRDNFRNRVSDLDTELADALDKLHLLDSEKIGLENTVRGTKDELNEARRAASQAKLEGDRLKETMQRMEQAASQREIGLREHVARLEKSGASQTLRVEDLEDKLSQMERELALAKNQLERNDEHLSEFKEERERLLVALESHRADLKAKHTEITSLMAEIQTANLARSDAENESSLRKSKIDALTTELAQSSRHVKTLTGELNNLQLQNDNVGKELSDANAAIAGQKNKISQLDAVILRLEAHVQELLGEASKKEHEAKEEKARMQAESEGLVSKCEHATERIHTLMAEVEREARAVMELRTKNSSVNEQLAASQKEADQWRQRAQESEDESKQLHSRIQTLLIERTDDEKKHGREIDALQAEVTHWKGEYSKVEDRVDKVESQFVEEVRKAKQKICDSEALCRARERDLTVKETEIASLRRAMEDITVELGREREAHDLERTNLDSQVSRLQQSIRDGERLVETKSLEIESLKNQLCDAESRFSDERDRHQRDQAAAESKSAHAKEISTMLEREHQAAIAEKDGVIGSVEYERTILREELKRERESHTATSRRMEALIADMHSVKASLGAMQESAEAAEHRIKEFESNAHDMRERYSKALLDYEDCQNELHQERNRMRDINVEVQALRELASSLDRDKKKLKAQITALHRIVQDDPPIRSLPVAPELSIPYSLSPRAQAMKPSEFAPVQEQPSVTAQKSGLEELLAEADAAADQDASRSRHGSPSRRPHSPHRGKEGSYTFLYR